MILVASGTECVRLLSATTGANCKLKQMHVIFLAHLTLKSPVLGDVYLRCEVNVLRLWMGTRIGYAPPPFHQMVRC